MKYAASLLLSVGLIAVVQHTPFFWDSIQFASKHADFFYRQHLKWTVLPADIDSGHPPFLGYYIACCWHWFGRALEVSHWAMLPVIYGIVFLLLRLGALIAPDRAWWLLPLVLVDPVVSGQLLLVSPDNLLLLGFLLVLNGSLRQTPAPGWIIAGAVLLCLTSMRGMMTCAGLILSLVLSIGWKKSWAFLPGMAAGATFLGWHYLQTGWIGHHPGSSWGPAFEIAGGMAMLKNMAVIGWRWVDLGRAGEWVLLLWLFGKFGKKIFASPFFRLLLCLSLFLIPTAILYSNLSAHRYFIPLFVVFHLWLFDLCRQLPIRNVVVPWVMTVLVLASGHTWIYPRGISMDWDSTAMQLVYHRLRAQAVDAVERQQIRFEQIGSAFPNLNTGDQLMLNGDLRHFVPINADSNQYIMASNVFNDINLDDYRRWTDRGWQVEQRWQNAGVWIELWRNPHFNNDSGGNGN